MIPFSPPPPFTIMNNRSVVYKQQNPQTSGKFKESPTPFCVDVANVWSFKLKVELMTNFKNITCCLFQKVFSF